MRFARRNRRRVPARIVVVAAIAVWLGALTVTLAGLRPAVDDPAPTVASSAELSSASSQEIAEKIAGVARGLRPVRTAYRVEVPSVDVLGARAG